MAWPAVNGREDRRDDLVLQSLIRLIEAVDAQKCTASVECLNAEIPERLKDAPVGAARGRPEIAQLRAPLRSLGIEARQVVQQRGLAETRTADDQAACLRKHVGGNLDIGRAAQLVVEGRDPAAVGIVVLASSDAKQRWLNPR